MDDDIRPTVVVQFFQLEERVAESQDVKSNSPSWRGNNFPHDFQKQCKFLHNTLRRSEFWFGSVS